MLRARIGTVSGRDFGAGVFRVPGLGREGRGRRVGLGRGFRASDPAFLPRLSLLPRRRPPPPPGPFGVGRGSPVVGGLSAGRSSPTKSQLGGVVDRAGPRAQGRRARAASFFSFCFLCVFLFLPPPPFFLVSLCLHLPGFGGRPDSPASPAGWRWGGDRGPLAEPSSEEDGEVRGHGSRRRTRQFIRLRSTFCATREVWAGCPPVMFRDGGGRASQRVRAGVLRGLLAAARRPAPLSGCMSRPPPGLRAPALAQPRRPGGLPSFPPVYGTRGWRAGWRQGRAARVASPRAAGPSAPAAQDTRVRRGWARSPRAVRGRRSPLAGVGLPAWPRGRRPR